MNILAHGSWFSQASRVCSPSPPKQAAAPADSAAAAPEVVSLFSMHCLSTLSAFWVHLGLTACPCLCTCLILFVVPTVACFPPKQAAALADNGASNLGPFNVDGISFKVEMNLLGNYVLLYKMMTYSGPGVSTFAACGQLSPDGRSLGMVSKQGTIAKVGKLAVRVAGIIFKSLGNEAYAMVNVLPNGAFAQYPVKVIKPLQNARAIGAVAGAAAKKVFEQQCLKWESARSMRNETVFDSLPVSYSRCRWNLKGRKRNFRLSKLKPLSHYLLSTTPTTTYTTAMGRVSLRRTCLNTPFADLEIDVLSSSDFKPAN